MIYSKILKSTPVKSFLMGVLRTCSIFFLKLHLSIMLSWLLHVNIYLDFFIQIFINICLSIYNDQIFSFIPYDAEIFSEIVTDLVNNYSNRAWMKQLRTLCVLGACTYSTLVLCIITINNTILIKIIIQYVITFFIIEYAELLPYLFNKYFNKPIIILHLNNINLINSYLPTLSQIPQIHASQMTTTSSLTSSIILQDDDT